jgi:hypothetical protein
VAKAKVRRRRGTEEEVGGTEEEVGGTEEEVGGTDEGQKKRQRKRSEGQRYG